MGRTVRYTESSPFITRLVIKEIVKTIGDNAYEDFKVLKELNYATVSGRLVITHLKDALP
jgi:hypothetical protein